MTNSLTAEKKQEIIEKRRIHNFVFDAILNATMQKMETIPYCKKILEDANYKKKRPDHFDPDHFYLEEIYIGHGCAGPNGHCTKESYKLLDKNEVDNKNATRDAVYLNEDMLMRVSIIRVLQNMADNGDPVAKNLLTENIPPRPILENHL